MRKQTVIEQAKKTLGHRLKVDTLSYILDGRRVGIFEVLKAAGIEIEKEK